LPDSRSSQRRWACIAITARFSCAVSGRGEMVRPVVTIGVSLAVAGLGFGTFSASSAGTPFFDDRWMKARLFDGNGDSYASHSVRLNLLDNDVSFLDADGTEMVTTIPVKKIQLTDTTTGTKYLFILGDRIPEADKAQAGVWLQVLVNDTVSLCRQIKKTIRETVPYGSSTTEREIVSVDIYFVHMNGSFIRLKDWSGLLQLFTDKKDAINQYIRDHHLNGKSADDYTQLVQYYNSIKSV